MLCGRSSGAFADRSSAEREGHPVLGDAQLIMQVVANLIQNIERYAPSGEVRISFSEENGYRTARFADSGPGIPAYRAGRIFTDGASAEGLGLGLSLSRQLARAMGGDLSIENPGSPGAVFKIRLPVSDAPLPPVEADGEVEDGVAWITINRPEVRNAFREQTLDELREAELEGIELHAQLQPSCLIRGDTIGLECISTVPGEPDESGRRRPQAIPDSEYIIDCDMVVVAIGTRANLLLTSSEPDLEINEWGYLVVDEDGMTSVPGIFAGGDIVRGASLVVWAIRDGREAADAMLARFGAAAQVAAE